MSLRDPALFRVSAILFAGMVAAAVSLPVAAVAFGPPPGAELSVEKLQRMDRFVPSECQPERSHVA